MNVSLSWITRQTHNEFVQNTILLGKCYSHTTVLVSLVYYTVKRVLGSLLRSQNSPGTLHLQLSTMSSLTTISWIAKLIDNFLPLECRGKQTVYSWCLIRPKLSAWRVKVHKRGTWSLNHLYYAMHMTRGFTCKTSETREFIY